MVSPFPGMDPFLEHPFLWPKVHAMLISCLAQAINALVPDGYAAAIGERVYVERSERSIYPDVLVSRRPGGREGTAAVAVLDAPETAESGWVFAETSVRSRETFVELLATQEGRRVVTHIEVLSPTNKRPGADGRGEYLRKQRQVLDAGVNLIEIDLLRAGEHTVWLPLEQLRARGTWTYLSVLIRPLRAYASIAWPVRLREPLGPIGVPLAEGEGEVWVTLQDVLATTYHAGRLWEMADYSAPPPPPAFSASDARWIGERLRLAGLRPASRGTGV
jgi:hypothetical protein